MALLHGLLWPLRLWNDHVLRVGRWIAIVAIALMVLAILIQVFFRYVLSNPLAWPEEAARFLMLWMTGLVAPTAYRRGGFVAIDLISEAMPKAAAHILNLALLLVSLMVLAVAVPIAFGEVTGFNAAFKTSALYYPTGDGWEKVPRVWMQYSIVVGTLLMIIVNIELLLRQIIKILGGEDDLPPVMEAEAGAE